MKTRFEWILIAGAVGLLLIIPVSLPYPIGKIDFPAYWSAGYLLAHGENFADPVGIFQIEKMLTTRQEDYPMLTWNPPWLLVLLIPYTWVSFDHAVWWWLLTNITLVFLSAVVMWQISAANERSRRFAFGAPLIAFAYSPTLMALIAGQVNLIVLAGLAGFLWFHSKLQFGRAGMALALTLVKAHLVYITVPLVLLYAVRKRQWRLLVGFFGELVVLSAIVFLLRPTFLSEYSGALSGGGLLNYITPTAGGILALVFGWNGFKLMGLLLLPLGVWISWRAGSWQISTLVDITLLASIITAPFGWSYDFVILLVPIIHAIVCLVEGKLPRVESFLIGGIFLFADGLMFYQRLQSPSEEYFFWVPLLVAGLIIWVWVRQNRMTNEKII